MSGEKIGRREQDDCDRHWHGLCLQSAQVRCVGLPPQQQIEFQEQQDQKKEQCNGEEEQKVKSRTGQAALGGARSKEKRIRYGK